jgi:hypothetical protein
VDLDDHDAQEDSIYVREEGSDDASVEATGIVATFTHEASHDA